MKLILNKIIFAHIVQLIHYVDLGGAPIILKYYWGSLLTDYRLKSCEYEVIMHAGNVERIQEKIVKYEA